MRRLLRRLVLLLDQPVEWTFDRVQNSGRDVCIARGRLYFRMAEQDLNHADVDTVLKEMRRKECRSVCGVTQAPRSALSAAA
jgi:hypothetical protein